MKASLRLVLALVPFGVVCACSSGTRSGPQAAPNANALASGAPSDSARCNAPVRGVDVSAWQLVTARGYTFCLPPGWTGRGDTRRQAGNSLTFGTGTPRGVKVPYVLLRVRRIGDGPLPASPAGTDLLQFEEKSAVATRSSRAAAPRGPTAPSACGTVRRSGCRPRRPVRRSRTSCSTSCGRFASLRSRNMAEAERFSCV